MAVISAGAVARGAVDFQFNYTDIGVGFNDPVEGAVRRAALEASADVLEGFLMPYSATIFMDVDGSFTDDATLAAAGSEFNGPITAGFDNRGDIGRKILGETDPAPGAADGIVIWNFEDHVWDLDDTIEDPNHFDFKSTAIHELMHAIGFTSAISEIGGDAVGTPAGDPNGVWDPFDEFLWDSTGALIDSSTFALDDGRWSAASIGGTGTVPPTTGLYFSGPNANAANGGNPIPLYSPSFWEDGSSGSHTDDFYFDGSNPPLLLMNAFADPGPSTRVISAIEVGMLRDIGLTLFGIPEPSSLTLLSLGVLVFGFRRRG